MPEFLHKGRVGANFTLTKLKEPYTISMGYEGGPTTGYLSLDGRIHLDVKQNGNTVGRLTLGELNGQCGALMVSGLQFWTEKGLREVGKEVWEEAVRIAKKCGYYYFFTTITAVDKHLTDFLKEVGFEKGIKFTNKRTGAHVQLWSTQEKAE